MSRSPPVVQDDPQADQLLSSLDRVGKDLIQVEKEVLNRVRSPVNFSDPTDDLARRIKHQQVGAAAAAELEQGELGSAVSLAPNGLIQELHGR